MIVRVKFDREEGGVLEVLIDRDGIEILNKGPNRLSVDESRTLSAIASVTEEHHAVEDEKAEDAETDFGT